MLPRFGLQTRPRIWYQIPGNMGVTGLFGVDVTQRFGMLSIHPCGWPPAFPRFAASFEDDDANRSKERREGGKEGGQGRRAGRS